MRAANPNKDGRVAPVRRRSSSGESLRCYSASEQRLKLGLSEVPPGACALTAGKKAGDGEMGCLRGFGKFDELFDVFF